mgnify:CR=1 FL=1
MSKTKEVVYGVRGIRTAHDIFRAFNMVAEHVVTLGKHCIPVVQMTQYDHALLATDVLDSAPIAPPPKPGSYTGSIKTVAVVGQDILTSKHSRPMGYLVERVGRAQEKSTDIGEVVRLFSGEFQLRKVLPAKPPRIRGKAVDFVVVDDLAGFDDAPPTTVEKFRDAEFPRRSVTKKVQPTVRRGSKFTKPSKKRK